MLVRSLAGIGETAAMIVGVPSGNGPVIENDLLRMRVADNIGNAGDEQIMRMMTMQHIVVSVPAGTEIYVIFEKSQQANAAGAEKTVHLPHLDKIPSSIRARRHNRRKIALVSRIYRCGLLIRPHFLAFNGGSSPIVLARRTS
jgi:hypothetical protein